MCELLVGLASTPGLRFLQEEGEKLSSQSEDSRSPAKLSARYWYRYYLLGISWIENPSSVVGQHLMDAVADPNPSFHFDTDPDLNPTLCTTCWKIWKINLNFIHSSANLLCSVVLVSFIES